MLFNSYVFVFLFLPLALAAWHILNYFRKYKAAQCVLVAMSLWFYGYFNHYYIILILCSVCGNWLISKMMECFAADKKRYRRLLGWLGILFNLGILFYFKYYDFFIINCDALLGTDWLVKNIALPLGISFYTFQQISFMADRMTGKAMHYHMIDYATYVVYFPQLVAGPIVSHDDLIPQFWEERQAFNYGNMLTGVRMFVIGLAKKALLADELGKIVDTGFLDVKAMDGLGAWIVMLSYTFQIFFDFSGYCDMAQGIAVMMNLKLPQNFNSPYQSLRVKEFWNRWHITLNAFFTKYVYIPLGGNRKGKWRTICNTLIVFLLSGLWHGANWTFVLWGLLHGMMVSLETLIDSGKNKRKMPGVEKAVRWLVTFGFVNVAWVLFRSNSISDAWEVYKRLFVLLKGNGMQGFVWTLSGSLASYKNYGISLLIRHIGGSNAVEWMYMVWMLMHLLAAAYLCTRPSTYEWIRKKEATKAEMCVLAVLFGCSVLSFSGLVTFLYFNF